MGGVGSGRKPDPVKRLTQNSSVSSNLIPVANSDIYIPNYSGLKEETAKNDPNIIINQDVQVEDTSSINLSVTNNTISGAVIAAGVDHDQLLNYVANEHIDWTASSAGTIHASNYVDNDTTYTAGTNISLAGTTFNVDDAFVLNTGDAMNGDYTVSGSILMEGLEEIQFMSGSTYVRANSANVMRLNAPTRIAMSINESNEFFFEANTLTLNNGTSDVVFDFDTNGVLDTKIGTTAVTKHESDFFHTYRGRVVYRVNIEDGNQGEQESHVLSVTGTTSAAVDITLPDETYDGQIVIVKDVDGNAGTNRIQVTAPNSRNIDGASTYTLNADYEATTFMWNSSAEEWNIISSYKE